MKKRKKLNANKLMGILFFSLLLVLGTCFFLKSDFFYLKYIEINNNKYLTKEDVNGLLNIEKNKNIFFYDLNNLKNRLKESSYIENCEIKRKIPNKLIVNIEEKNIIGPIYNGKSYAYIDNSGNFVDQIKKNKKNEPVIYVKYTLNNQSLKFVNKNDEMKEKKGITIYLNKDNNIEKNITKLRKILVDLQNRKELYGKIDFTYNNYILYSPYNN